MLSDVHVYKQSHWLQSENIVMFRYIPGKYRDIPPYSVIFRDIPAFRVFTTPDYTTLYKTIRHYTTLYNAIRTCKNNFLTKLLSFICEEILVFYIFHHGGRKERELYGDLRAITD